MIETFLNSVVYILSSFDSRLFLLPILLFPLSLPIRFVLRQLQLYSFDCSFHSCLPDPDDPEPEVDLDLKKYYDYKVDR